MFPGDEYPEAELLNHILVLFFLLFRFPQWLHPFPLPPTMHKGSLSPPPHQPLLCLFLLLFLIIAILTGMRGHLILILICVALVIGAVGHFVFLLFLAAPWRMEFLGRGSDSSWSCDLCGSARAFNPRCRAGDGTCILVWQSRR